MKLQLPACRKKTHRIVLTLMLSIMSLACSDVQVKVALDPASAEDRQIAGGVETQKLIERCEKYKEMSKARIGDTHEQTLMVELKIQSRTELKKRCFQAGDQPAKLKELCEKLSLQEKMEIIVSEGMIKAGLKDKKEAIERCNSEKPEAPIWDRMFSGKQSEKPPGYNGTYHQAFCLGAMRIDPFATSSNKERIEEAHNIALHYCSFAEWSEKAKAAREGLAHTGDAVVEEKGQIDLVNVTKSRNRMSTEPSVIAKIQTIVGTVSSLYVDEGVGGSRKGAGPPETGEVKILEAERKNLMRIITNGVDGVGASIGMHRHGKRVNPGFLYRHGQESNQGEVLAYCSGFQKRDAPASGTSSVSASSSSASSSSEAEGGSLELEKGLNYVRFFGCPEGPTSGHYLGVKVALGPFKGFVNLGFNSDQLDTLTDFITNPSAQDKEKTMKQFAAEWSLLDEQIISKAVMNYSVTQTVALSVFIIFLRKAYEIRMADDEKALMSAKLSAYWNMEDALKRIGTNISGDLLFDRLVNGRYRADPVKNVMTQLKSKIDGSTLPLSFALLNKLEAFLSGCDYISFIETDKTSSGVTDSFIGLSSEGRILTASFFLFPEKNFVFGSPESGVDQEKIILYLSDIDSSLSTNQIVDASQKNFTALLQAYPNAGGDDLTKICQDQRFSLHPICQGLQKTAEDQSVQTVVQDPSVEAKAARVAQFMTNMGEFYKSAFLERFCVGKGLSDNHNAFRQSTENLRKLIRTLNP